MKSQSGSWVVKCLAVLLAILLLAAAMVTDVPTAYAEEPVPTDSLETTAPDAEPTPTPEPMETPLPSGEPLPGETPQPTDTMPPVNESEIIQVNGAECLSDEIIVKFKDNVSDGTVAYTLDAMEIEVEQELPADDLVVAEVPVGETVESYIETMEELPEVEYAQPNFIYRLEDYESDATSVNDPYAYGQWYLNTIGAYAAWDITKGSPNIKVAVIDTGIDLDHPDLAGQVYAQIDTVDNDGSANDETDGHGTHVAGIIAAKANNGIGVAGIAPGVKLVIADVFGPQYAESIDIIEGINFAMSKGSDVINMSLGDSEDDIAFHQAIDAAVNSGIVCVVAAGNKNTSSAYYPSDYESCISVISTNSHNERSSFSNYGSLKDISAPGEDILSTFVKKYPSYSYYESLNGTSMASPIVAATAALVLSVNPNLTVEQVKEILYSTATDVGAVGKDTETGYGVVNAMAAVYKTAGRSPYRGSGTSADPYLISTPSELNTMRFSTNSYFALTNDIDMTAATRSGGQFYNKGDGWLPIASFGGSFNGNGYSITGLYSCDGGLFDVVGNGGTVQRVNMRNCLIDAGVGVGGIANENIGSISYCNVDGVITGGVSIGGIVGDNRGTVFACANLSTVTAEYFVGGIAGCSWSGSISNCYNKGVITATSTYYSNDAGGIVGFCSSTTLSNCFNEGRIAAYDSIWGSIVGYSLNNVNNCYTITDGSIYRTCGRIPYDSAINCYVFGPAEVNQMRLKNSFSGFDFTNVWTIEEGKTFPTLRAVPYVHISSMTLNTHTLKIKQGRTADLIATILPSNAYNQRVIWTSSNPSIATVLNGKVTMVGDGTATITAQTLDGAYIDSCTVKTMYEYSIGGYSATPAYGTVTGSGTYDEDTVVTLSAIPYAGCRFVRWTDGVAQISTSATYQVAANTHVSVMAEFAPIGTPALSAASSDFDRVSLSWTPVEGVTGYEVWRSKSSGSGYIKINTVSTTNYIDLGLTSGTMYYYKVNAYCWASTATTYGNQASASATPVPTKPGTIYASPTSYNSAYVSWGAVSGASGYELSRSTSQNGSYSVVKTTSSLSYTNTSLGTGTTYYYRVRAYRTVGRTKAWGDYSAITSATPVLSSVASASASAYYPTSIKVSWSAVAGRTKYEVWRCESATGTYTRIGSTTSTYYKDTTCTPFVTYYYQIKVYRTVNRQPIYSAGVSPTASATPILGNVTGVKAAVSSPSSVKVSWASVTGASGYEVLRSATIDGVYVSIKSTTSRSFTDTSCMPNTTYYYQVRAYRKAGGGTVSSTPSVPLSATPYFGSVANVRAVSSSPSSIKVSWSSVSGASGYEVLRRDTPDGVYALVTSTTRAYFTDSNRIPNTTYGYQVRAYRTVNGVRHYSTAAYVSAAPYFGSVSSAKAVRSSAGKIKLTWSAVSGRTGYEIYRRSSSDSDFVLLKTTTSTSFTDSGLTTGVTYEYKIVAYRTVNGVKYRSTEPVVSATP